MTSIISEISVPLRENLFNNNIKEKLKVKYMKNIMLSLMTAMVMTACTGQKAEKVEATQDNFNYVVDQFADLQILRYQVPGFESFSLKQKQLLYHLSEAALMGRDILFDQTVVYNLPIRRALEAVIPAIKEIVRIRSLLLWKLI